MPDLAPGSLFAGCRIDGVAGRGGMGVVYRATQLALERPVALKVILAEHASEPEFRERFQREQRVAAAIDHPNVVPVYAAGEEDGRLYLVMRYVPGTDLHALVRDRGPVDAGRAAAIVAQLASALDAAHAAGLVHRDVKPANVLLDGAHAYLADFGLMRAFGAEGAITDSGRWMGTVDYAAPEQLRADRCDARSDVYALGCVLYAALTGGPPFPRDTVPAAVLAHANDPPPRPSDAGARADFDRVISRALAKDPDGRYPSAGDLGRAALAAARGEPITEQERSVARGEAAPDAPTRRLVPLAADPGAPATAATRALWATDGSAGEGEGDAGAGANGGGRLGGVPPTEIAPGGRPRPRAVPADARPTELAPGGGVRPGDVPIRRSRGRRRAVVATTVVLAAAGLAASLLVSGLFDTGAAVARDDAEVSAQEVRAILDTFAAAYATEDAAMLASTLASDVKRTLPGDEQRGRGDVVAEYRRQYAGNAITDYELTDLDAGGGPVGRATGSYSVSVRGRTAFSGRITFAVIREDDRPRIALIAAVPAT
jgi:serine/threonine-protein kinase